MNVVIKDVELRRFTQDDTNLLYELRNHISIRKGMRDSSQLDFGNHKKWVQENLILSNKVVLFIAYYKTVPVAILMLKNFEDVTAEVGVMVKNAGNYLNGSLVSKLICGIFFYSYRVLKLNCLTMYVAHSNSAAYKFNKKLDAVEFDRDDTYIMLKLTSDVYLSSPIHTRFNSRYKPYVLLD